MKKQMIVKKKKPITRAAKPTRAIMPPPAAGPMQAPMPGMKKGGKVKRKGR